VPVHDLVGRAHGEHGDPGVDWVDQFRPYFADKVDLG
jgi:hypothetical protein